MPGWVRLLFGALALGAMSAGCASRPPVWHGYDQSGYVELGSLAERSPLWRHVEFYDRMIAAIPPQPPAMPRAESGDATLPALEAPAEARTDLALDAQRTRLDQVRQREIAELTQRLAEAREYRLGVEAFAWRREQDAKTEAEIERIDADYAAAVDAETEKADVRLINLKMQVDALEETLSQRSQWVLSPPPAPRLDRDRADLAEKTKELEDSRNTETALLAGLQAAHQKQLDQALEQSNAALKTLRAEQEADYRDQDAHEIEVAQTRLQQGMDSVLAEVAAAENRSWIQSTAPSAKTVAYPWPRPSIGVVDAERNIEIARLNAARQRWIDYAYVNTRLAVADIAAKRHWNITIDTGGGPVRSTAKDMTMKVAALLSTGVWSVNG